MRQAGEQRGLEETPASPAPAGGQLNGRLPGLSGEFAQETQGHRKKHIKTYLASVRSLGF